MATSLDRFSLYVADYANKKGVLKELRKGIRKPLPKVRKAIRARARNTLPKRGGLNRWVAKIKITAKIKATGKTVYVDLVGKRSSISAESDMNRLDREGKIRHPSWGRRGKGQWHPQIVTPGFFSEPATEVDQWAAAVEKAADDACKVIARG